MVEAAQAEQTAHSTAPSTENQNTANASAARSPNAAGRQYNDEMAPCRTLIESSVSSEPQNALIKKDSIMVYQQ